MAEPTPAEKVKDKEYTNWLKMTLALYYMKSGLHTFIQSEVDSLHQSIAQKIYAGQTVQLSYCTTCNPKCSRRNKYTQVWKFETQCKLSCNAWFDELLALHVNPKSDKIYWSNSNVSLWPFNPWECAKVYLPRGQQPANTGPTKSDAQALLVLLTNCKHLNSKLSSQGQKLLPKISVIRNTVIHNGEMKVSDADRASFMQQIIQLLEDPVCLGSLEDCNTAVRNIHKIDSDSLDVSFNLGLPMPALSAAVNELRLELGMKENTNANNIESLKEEFIKFEKQVTKRFEEVEKKFELHRKNTEERFEDIQKKIDLQGESTTKKLEDLEMNLLLHSENITKTLQDVGLELCLHGEGAAGERHSKVEEEVGPLQKPYPKSQKKKKNGNWNPGEKNYHTGEKISDPFFAMETENQNQEGTVKPYDNFNADQDAEVLRNAMKGIGTDEKTLINVLCYRSNPQRQEIALAYKTMFGKDLMKDIKSETSGNFFKTLKALLMRPADYDAYQLRKAMKILHTDKDVLIGILCTRSNAQIKEIIKVYKEKFNRDLEKDIESSTSGDLRCFLISLVLASRSDSKEADRDTAVQDAKVTIQLSGKKKWETERSKCIQILVSQSYPQLRATFEEYSSLSKKDMEEVLKSELSGDIRNGMQTIVHCVRNKFAHFAQLLEKLGTDDNTLIRIIVSRCEIDMVQIKEEFLKLTSQTFEQYIAVQTLSKVFLCTFILIHLLQEFSVSRISC
ncbi:hypothetical protein ACJMK2_022310 [Sinanodonta woodiana]|uniref:Annexin n=1 Tax=Sinanodonta woodiana TaxID=1069815 RepID=A0ABD3TIM9_SINWO